jgi:CubicO group peptidase (beta-lactamase class C family)
MRHPASSARTKGLLSLLLAATLLGQPVCGQPAAGDHAQALDAIFARWNRPDTPGCAVGVAAAGAPPLFREYGSSDLEHDVPIREETVFEAGSVSKQFTAASILLLVQQGKLALTDDVHRYIPELPDYGSPVTIDHLLSHTSGLRDWGEVEALAGWPRTSRIYTPADVLAITARQRSLNFPPGTEFSYTNTGYSLAALIVERVSGQTLARFSQEHLFTPLGMTHTGWRDDFRRIVKGRAIAYYALPFGRYEQVMPFENTYGHGGLLTTVGDLMKWNDALTKGVLGEQVTAAMQHPAILKDGRQIHYARGLFLESWRGTPEVAHPGATAAYRAWLGRYPQAQLSIALLCNSTDADTAALAHAVADVYLPREAAAATSTAVSGDAEGTVAGPIGQAASPDAQDLARLAGRYISDEALATWVIEVGDGHLTATPADRRGFSLTLKPQGPDTFTFANPYVEGRLRFDRDGKGAVVGFTMMSARVYGLKFQRVPGVR